MPLTRRELLRGGVPALVGFLIGTGCSSEQTPVPARPKAETGVVGSDRAPTAVRENTSLEIQPLWSESAYREQAFFKIYDELKAGKAVIKNNLETGRVIFLKDPDQKPFYDSCADIKPVYGQVLTFYREYQNPHSLWPLAQEYKTLGFLNVFLIGSYQDFPQEARTLKTGAKGQVSAEANVVKVLSDGSLEIEEVHYDSGGKPIFRCTSQFDKDMIKVGETNIQGKKKEDYFFVWPMAEK